MYGSRLLDVSLDLTDRPHIRVGRVFPELTPGPALPEQVPALIECFLGGTQLRMLVLARQFTSGELATQLVLSLNELVDVTKYVLVVHRMTFLIWTRGSAMPRESACCVDTGGFSSGLCPSSHPRLTAAAAAQGPQV